MDADGDMVVAEFGLAYFLKRWYGSRSAWSSNYLRLKKPGIWQKFAKDDPSMAQCTVASVLPKAVATASKARLWAAALY